MQTRAYSAVAALLAGVIVLASSSTARAEEPAPGAEPAPPHAQPPPAPPIGYVAPLSQTTQPSYVPQSVALSGPREIRDYKAGEAVPPGYHVAERTRTGLVVGGAVTFGSLYLLSLLVAAGGADLNRGGTNPVAALYVPALGPFIQMASTESSTGKVFLAIDGLAQTAGAIMFVVGLASPRTVLLRNDLAQKPKVMATPIVGKGMTGAGVVGTF